MTSAVSPAAVITGLLELEDSVVYGVDAAGGVLAATGGSLADQQLMNAADAAHRARRDELTSLLEGMRVTVPAAAPGYRLPSSLTGVAPALAFVAGLEDRCAAEYRIAVELLVQPALRAVALDGLADAAVRATQLRTALGQPPGQALRAFPGGP